MLSGRLNEPAKFTEPINRPLRIIDPKSRIPHHAINGSVPQSLEPRPMKFSSFGSSWHSAMSHFYAFENPLPDKAVNRSSTRGI